jgi:hypothetical protein
MIKQRLIFLVALVCIAQLGFVILTEATRYLRKHSQKSHPVVSRDMPLNSSPEASRASLKPAPTDSRVKDNPPKALQRKTDVPAAAGNVSPTSVVVNRAPRDPFVPFFSIKQSSEHSSSSTLADFELSELRLTAIIKDSQGNYSASVKAPNERNFIIKVGSLIGLNGGKVSAITDSKILVLESSDAGVEGSSTAPKELVLKRSEPADG